MVVHVLIPESATVLYTIVDLDVNKVSLIASIAQSMCRTQNCIYVYYIICYNIQTCSIECELLVHGYKH